MLNGLDLFSGIGGISYALAEWVRPVAYCEIDAYATGVLLSRMCSGELPRAPIWDDVKTLHGRMLPSVDIICGGFPCQDISVAGLGKGLEGERSGLFFEILRLVDETRPKFIFLENVSAIITRGLSTVTAEITKRGYDCRWITLSAQEVGALHKRERWWMLAHSNGSRKLQSKGNEQNIRGRPSDLCKEVPNSDSEALRKQSITLEQCKNKTIIRNNGKKEFMADTKSKRLEGLRDQGGNDKEFRNEGFAKLTNSCMSSNWWAVEPDVGRVANGIPNRVDRIKGLGNSVVPLQAKEAFKSLMGLYGS